MLFAWVAPCWLISIIMGSTLVEAEDNRFATPSWQSTCTVGDHKFIFSFKSKSGASAEDDMSVTLAVDQKKAIDIALPKALYIQDSPKDTQLCDHHHAFVIGSNVFIFVRKDSRPGLDELALVVLNAKSGRVLDVAPRIGAVLNGAFELLQGNRLRLRLAQGWKKDAQSDGPENILEAWKIIKFHKGTIKSYWENKLPMTHKVLE